MNNIRLIAPIRSFKNQFSLELRRDQYVRAKKRLEEHGYQISIPSRFSEMDLMETPWIPIPPPLDSLADRIRDIQEAWDDPKIQIVMILTGGQGGEDILEHLPYDSIRFSSKVLVGHSQATQLLNVLTQNSSTRCIYGVNLLDLGDEPQHDLNTSISIEALVRALNSPKDSEFTAGNARLEWIRRGESIGSLIGGELEALIELPLQFRPNLSRKILMIEVANARTMASFAGAIESLRSFDGFEELSGLLISYFPEFGDEMKSYVTSNIARIPVVYGCSSGHFRPRTSLPLGFSVEIYDEDNPAVKFRG